MKDVKVDCLAEILSRAVINLYLYDIECLINLKLDWAKQNYYSNPKKVKSRSI